MEKLSQITDVGRVPVSIDIHPHFMDHRFEGKAVLPAVEAMILLAGSTQAHVPDIHAELITSAAFDKFLYLPDGADAPAIDAFNDIDLDEDGRVRSRLITRTRSKTHAISRVMEHVSLTFATGDMPAAQWPPPSDLLHLGRDHIAIAPETIYRELVPFGPSYHNIRDDLHLSEHGALALMQAPRQADVGPLGSPFPLDAAFHAACVWCQCFLKFTGFPVGFATRQIRRPVAPGHTCTARMIPGQVTHDSLTCDLWLFDPGGDCFEAVLGVVMKDVSRGRYALPRWIMDIPSF